MYHNIKSIKNIDIKKKIGIYCSFKDIEKYLKNYISYFENNNYKIYHYNLNLKIGDKFNFKDKIIFKKNIIIAKLYKIDDYINIQKIIDKDIIILCFFLGQRTYLNVIDYDYIIFDNEYLRKNVLLNRLYNKFFNIYAENILEFKKILKNNKNKYLIIDNNFNKILYLKEFKNKDLQFKNYNENNRLLDFIYDYYN